MNYRLRSTVGVLVGCINILGFSATLIYIIKVLCDFGKLSDSDIERNQDVVSKTLTLLYIILVICVVAIILSGLLIAGIIKERHLLMLPWLICAFVGIVCQTFRSTIGFLSELPLGATTKEVFTKFSTNLLVLGIQVLIFYIIYKLYKNIRGIENSARSQTQHEETVLNAINENPPSYSELERSGQLSK